MTKTFASRANVEKAYRELVEAGLTPSIRGIRDKLGGGSLSTITKHVGAIELEAREVELAKLMIFPATLKALSNNVDKVKKETADIYEDAIAEQQARNRHLETLINELESQLNASESAQATLEKARVELEAKHEANRDRHKANEKHLEQVQLELARQTVAREHAETAMKDLTAKLTKVEAALAESQAQNHALELENVRLQTQLKIPAIA